MLFCLSALAADHWVGSAATPTFEDAFDAASSGDRILVPPGTWGVGFNNTADTLTIQGVGNAATVVLVADGSSQSNSMLRVQGGDVTVRNLTLDGDDEATPLAVYDGGSATVEHVRFVRGLEPLSFGGGGCLDIFDDGEVVVRDSRFDDCHAGERGGAVEVSSGALELSNSRVIGSSADNWGGGVYCSGDAMCDIDSTLFEDNESARGGGLYIHNAAGDVRRSVFCDNFASADGAASWLSNASHIVRNNVFWNNQSTGNGAAIRADDTSSDVGVYTIQGRHNLFGYNQAGTGGTVHTDDMRYVSFGDIFTNHDGTAAFAAANFNNPAAVELDFVVDHLNTTLTNDVATHVLAMDPLLAGPSETGCSPADWTLSPGSPAIDVGPQNDPDGTPGDLGPFGGPDAMVDADGDSFYAPWDCNDADGDVHPGAIEICNGIDDDCDFGVDEGLPTTTWYVDGDGDGAGGALSMALCDGTPFGLIEVGGDCDDGNDDFGPAAPELCDGLDNNCDGQVDEGLPQLEFFVDLDGDGYGAGAPVSACAAPPGRTGQDGDCDDANTSFNPGAAESDCADPNDYNCDGSVQFMDQDGDGFAACEECDDGDSSVNPDAFETCDGVDENCNGVVDDEAIDRIELAADNDRDGFGNPDVLELQCAGTSGWVDDRADCDDDAPGVNPDANEIADNGVDEDCDGVDAASPESEPEPDKCGCASSTSSMPFAMSFAVFARR